MEKSPRSEKLELTVDQCVKKAQGFIDKNGQCLFLFDVKNSKKYLPPERRQLQFGLKNMISEINIEFDQYFPINKLATLTREEKGFYDLLGDGSWVGINNSEIIPKIIESIQQKLPNVSFSFNVAKDGLDQEGLKIVK